VQLYVPSSLSVHGLHKEDNGQNLGEFCYICYAISVVLLMFVLWNTLKMVTGVTENMLMLRIKYIYVTNL
jgi:hypothetical protein